MYFLKEISDILKTSSHVFSMELNGKTVLDNDTFRFFSNRQYGDRLMFSDNDLSSTEWNDLFLECWNCWKVMNRESFEKMYLALTTDYNPLSNYDKKSTFTDSKTGNDMTIKSSSRSDESSGTDTTTGTNKDTTTYNTTDTNQSSGTDTITGSSTDTTKNTVNHVKDEVSEETKNLKNVTKKDVSAYNDVDNLTTDNQTTSTDTGTDTTKNTAKNSDTTNETVTNENSNATKYGKTDTNKKTGTDTTDNTNASTISYGKKNTSTDSGTDTITYNSTVTHTEQTAGNIGVTTSQDMLTSELILRSKYKICEMILDSFYNFATIYC